METIKYNLTYNDAAKELLDFINKTEQGCYTKEKPILTDVKFRRIDIQENSEIPTDHILEENLLFGITY
jgi:hypothetical protein